MKNLGDSKTSHSTPRFPDKKSTPSCLAIGCVVVLLLGTALLYASAPAIVSYVSEETEPSSDRRLRELRVEVISYDILNASLQLRKDEANLSKHLPLLQAVENAQIRISHAASIVATKQDLTAFLKSYEHAMRLLGERSSANLADITLMKASLIEGALIVAAKAEQDKAKAVETEKLRMLIELVRGAHSLSIRDSSENEQRGEILEDAYEFSQKAITALIER